MSLRPAYANWFELITTREDLTSALSTLAATGRVELETHSHTYARYKLEGLEQRLQDWHQLARRYRRFLPTPNLTENVAHGRPRRLLGEALMSLRRWEKDASSLVSQHNALSVKAADLGVFDEFLQLDGIEELDFSLLGIPCGGLCARLFVLPPHSDIEELPATVISQHRRSHAHDFLLAVGSVDDISRLTTDISSIKGRPVPWMKALPSDLEETRDLVATEQKETQAALSKLEKAIAELSQQHAIASAIAKTQRVEWLVNHIDSLPASANFAWVTGWTKDADAGRLNHALQQAGIDGLVHCLAAPDDLQAPVLMKNPGWAQPFEVFARMLGTPSHDEADPSRLLAFIAPLLFGYMFGDVGQGLVLAVVGLMLQQRWPVLRMLVINGLAAMAFGLVFGSVFGREDLIPALWLHPIEHPLPVLGVPLLGGIGILLLGLSLNALGAHWRGEWRRWLQTDAAAMLLYVAIITSLFINSMWPVAVIALLWYFTGHWLQAQRSKLVAIGLAAGELLEGTLQLLINTLSFVRVGAFALAHAGLSLAVVNLADSVASPVMTGLIMLIGNVVIILLEGLVVSIQTTRLILFEFFIRFLTGSGRLFRPLLPPQSSISPRSEP